MNRGKKTILILITLFLIIGFEFNTHYITKKLYPLKYKEQVIYYSKEYKVDPYLVFAVIYAESGFNPNVISNKNAVGLMQILPETGRWVAKNIGIKDYNDNMLFVPKYNIQIGTWYLGYLLRLFDNNIHLAVAAYNGGSSNVDNWLKDKRFSTNGKSLHKVPFPETDKYLKKVFTAYKIYKYIYENK
ncbi:MAG: lytic transglycosylase domain-containing protein [Thermoanaerobacteraceae bacterium]